MKLNNFIPNITVFKSRLQPFEIDHPVKVRLWTDTCRQFYSYYKCKILSKFFSFLITIKTVCLYIF